MAVSPNTKASLRKTLSILLLAGLLAFLLVLYFLKYVPDQRSDFHRRAFLELSQIDRALQTRNKAYLDVIRNSVDSLPADSIPNALQRYNFTYETFRRYDTIRKLRPNDTLVYQRIRFDQKKIMGNWELAYLLSEKNNDTAVAKLSKDLDSILNPLASTYRDIFSDYLLILDTSTNLTPESPGPQNAYNHKGRVVFNSGRLSVDFLVNMDTLLKKTDGFSLLNIHDVKIEGNPYKLFLYPILLCNQRVILAGLISESRYREGSESVPIDMLTIGGLILLLLLLNLPILKMYIIGPMERITEMDIRLIIATYFVAAFVIFFLFSSCFLTQIQNSTSRTSLQKLSAAIRYSVYSHIRNVTRPPKYYTTHY